MKVIERDSSYRDAPDWHVHVDVVDGEDEVYSVRAWDSEDAAYFVAQHVGDASTAELHFRSKESSTRIRLADGRNVLSAPAWEDYFGACSWPPRVQ